MNPTRRVLWTLGAVLLMGMQARASVAQVNGSYFTFEPWGGYAKFAKNVNLKNTPVGGATFGIIPYRYFGFEGHVGYGQTSSVTGFTPYAVPAALVPAERELTMLHYGGDLVVNFRPSAYVAPYVLAGWQEARIRFTDTDSVPKGRYLNGLEAGAGVKVRFGPRVALRAEVRDAMWKFADGTPPPAGKDGTDNLFMTAGLEFTLGGVTGASPSKDADNDGVPNKRDKCPDTPMGAKVDATGCPMDSDGDGVWDGIDQCPNTPSGASVDAHGCPGDDDKDGVPNGVDQCADTPSGAIVDAHGCPKDADKDGVWDGIDQCADTPAGAKVDARGCTVVTDADGDGVPDDKDLCPFTPTNVKVDKDGCPIELSERETQLLDKGRITERNIHFVTAKWDILPESQPILNELGNILIQWPRLRIEIGGHTDGRGSNAYNQKLSEQRANAVLEYLTGKYPQITREQYTAVGYGESQPVGSNSTIEGMAMNRRVEFKVLNTEELKKERERRRTLTK